MVNKLKNMSPKTMNVLKFMLTLILVVALAVGSTYAWFVTNLTSTVDNGDKYITVSADAGLKLSYDEEMEQEGQIYIPNLAELTECSSVDGRNIFFPISDYSQADKADKEFVDDVTTDDLIFREATANDKNNKYISIDFTVEASSYTDVWLSNKSYINGTAADAIRVSFDLHDGKTPPIVLDNSTVSYQKTNMAVASIDTNGLVKEVTEQVPCMIDEYVNLGEGSKALFSIDANTTLNVTMTIWLEGTDLDCTADILNKNDLDINIEFSTVVEEPDQVKFIDHTLEKWAEDDECKIFVQDKLNPDRLYNMTQSTEDPTVWTLQLPAGVDEINFVRKHPTDNTVEWNVWDAGTVGNCKTYNAFGHEAGMWEDDFSGTTITLFDGTPNGYLRDNNAEMHLMFSVVDGNGATQNLDYKLSYQNEYYRWQIVIPSQVTGDIDFKRMNSEQTSVYGSPWTNVPERGNNLYITINSATSAYWGNKLIYLEDEANIKGDDGTVFAAYFYDDSGNNLWTGMRAYTSTGRYVAAVPDGYTHVVLTRYKGTATTWDWSNRHNEIADNNKTFGTNNLFKTSAWQNNDGVIYGTWYQTDNTW